MSSSDQAKSKLLDSMRLSKQGSPATKEAPKEQAPSKTSKVTKSSKPVSKPASTDKKSKSVTKTSSDNYLDPHRVWPD